MGINLAGLGVVYNNTSALNQQLFQLLAVPGSLTLVAVDGVIQDPRTYVIDRSILTFNAPLAAGLWIYVVSGQGGTFTPQSYVDAGLAVKPNRTEVDTALAGKASLNRADFTGPVTVQEPTLPMQPATKQMVDALPDIATPTYVDAAVANKVTSAVFSATVDNLINKDQKGIPNGVTENGADGRVKIAQVPHAALYRVFTLYLTGTLSVGRSQYEWRERYGGVINNIQVSVDAVPVGADLRINLMRNSTPVFANAADYITISDGTWGTEVNFASPPTFLAGEQLGFRIEQVGSTTAGGPIHVRFEITHLPI